MIHYHGLPITPASAAAEVLFARHAFVSFAHPDQLEIALEVCQSFAVDNGAFSAWRSGNPVADWTPYYKWVGGIKRMPGFDFACIPDVIDGNEKDNNDLLSEWPHEKHLSAPVWHMHESIERLSILCQEWPRVAIGSSGKFSTVGSSEWWNRMAEAFNSICDSSGLPPCRIHGLRMLNQDVFTRLPLASADSTNIGKNVGIDSRWNGAYAPPDKVWRARVLASRIESHNAAARWNRQPTQELLI